MFSGLGWNGFLAEPPLWVEVSKIDQIDVYAEAHSIFVGEANDDDVSQWHWLLEINSMQPLCCFVEH